MMDLRSGLDQVAGPAREPTDGQVDADIARGRSALRRRRTMQGAAGSAFAAVAVVAAVAFTATHSGSTAPAYTAEGAPAATASATAELALVAYKGKQPAGFTVDKVPDGWFIQASDEGALVIAPEDPSTPVDDPWRGPSAQQPVKPSVAPLEDPESFVGKIVVFLQSKDQGAPEGGKKVKVGDADGVLVGDPAGSDGTTLWIEQPNKIYAQVQFWQKIGLTADQMVEFGAGVHVHKGAVQGVG
ncbi:hypothetical protein [Winogradskya humida]|uniref:Uncharacterized protein n=1 Tax=Winogradskya humida TaxID=113566 RepID=A0ABQ4A6E2_9ACTN|nr:hypothetical protein [Actinoplanes humidus]GIE26406.1 hypothetical protein Ahu01nite_095080 [Actinoplanes humidus]